MRFSNSRQTAWKLLLIQAKRINNGVQAMC